jgi:hypothetical protein
MGSRGHKICPVCQKVCGVKLHNCVCGFGFTIKGIKMPDIVLNVNKETPVSSKSDANDANVVTTADLQQLAATA